MFFFKMIAVSYILYLFYSRWQKPSKYFLRTFFQLARTGNIYQIENVCHAKAIAMAEKIVINWQDGVIADVVIIGLENTVNVCIVYIKSTCFYVFYSMSSDILSIPKRNFRFQCTLSSSIPCNVFFGGGFENVFEIYINLQYPRYLLFCEGGIFNAHALTLMDTEPTPYIGITL